jgi:hypothetical protein
MLGGVFCANIIEGQMGHRSNDGVAMKCHIFLTRALYGNGCSSGLSGCFIFLNSFRGVNTIKLYTLSFNRDAR